VNTRDATYFNNVKDTSLISLTSIPESVIQKNDILNISVSSMNPEASAIYNAPNESMANGNQISGYLVNEKGTIQFPVLEEIRAEGLTKEQLKVSITKSLLDKKLLVDPIVNIRFQNFRVTVLGEVARPTVVSVPSEKISLLEALGFAGDLTIYAKRNNVLLIREEEGKKIIRRINLNSNELFTSPYYYLKSNDIVYVEPNKAKVASVSRSQQWLPVVLSVLSLGIIVTDRIVN
ncbi:MAG: polysaccharide biosynthesis/export family protein, partial [Chitinophagaceae bacterium]